MAFLPGGAEDERLLGTPGVGLGSAWGHQPAAAQRRPGGVPVRLNLSDPEPRACQLLRGHPGRNSLQHLPLLLLPPPPARWTPPWTLRLQPTGGLSERVRLAEVINQVQSQTSSDQLGVC